MTMPRQPDETTEAHPGRQPPVALWINAFAGLASPVPARWTRTGRRRRLLFLALCAPGFVAIFATPLHHNFFLLVFGIVLFAAAALFRALTEPLFERADAAGRLITSPSPPPRRTLAMRRLVATTAAVAALSLGLSTIAPPTAQAQIAVIDPQAIVQAIKQVEQQLQMITQLQQQVASQAAMLQKLGVDVTGPLQQIASEATQLLQTAQGIGYQGQNLAQQFQQAYPTDLKGMSFAQTRQALAGWQANSRQTLQEAMATQNLIVRSQPTTAGAVNAAVAASQNAAGQTAAIQATNQLLASLSTQLTQLQTILITQGRAQQTAEAQAQGARAAGAAESQRYWNVQHPASRVKNPGDL